MSISYPLGLPTVTGIRNVSIRAINSVAYSQSPFTFTGQTHAYQGQMWQADVSIPAMRADQAEQWIAFLLSLRGQFGTFLFGDPNRTSLRGTATACTVTGAAGDNTVSATVTSGQTILAGDYIQLGSGATAALHKVLFNYTGTGAAADLEIWPGLRVDRSSVTATLSNAQGVFRLSSNEQEFSINEAEIYGITFAAREAI